MRTKQGAIGKDFGKDMKQVETVENQLLAIAYDATALCLMLSQKNILTQDDSDFVRKNTRQIIVNANCVLNMLLCYSEMEEE